MSLTNTDSLAFANLFVTDDTLTTAGSDTLTNVSANDTVTTLSLGSVSSEFDVPVYKTNDYFEGDSLSAKTTKELVYLGESGDPVPQTIRGDDLFTSLLLISFIIFTVSVSSTRKFIGRQLNHFFYSPASSHTLNETSNEIKFQIFLVALSCLLLSIATYIFANEYIAETYAIDNYRLVALFYICYAGYFTAKGLLYEIVNNVFFPDRQINEWRRTLLFITAMESVLLFPVVLIQVYLNLSAENTIFYYVFILILAKIVTFYKSWSIFFKPIGVFLQNILYFCTLEIVPILLLAGGLRQLIDVLKITF